MGWVVSATPWPLYPIGKRANTYSTGDWVGPRAGAVPDISLGPGFNPQTIQMLSVNIQKEKCGIKKYIVAMYMCNSMKHLKIYHMQSCSHINEDQKWHNIQYCSLIML
jgi:hypothetical protein